MAALTPLLRLSGVLWLGWCAAASAQGSPQHYDLNVYPALNAGGGLYDLNVAGSQNGPPGTIMMSSAAPPQAYSFQDVLRNTHGYFAAGVSSRNGHSFDGGVSIPLVPGKADLLLSASTGQLPTFPINGNSGKPPAVTFDSYSAGLALHPTDDIQAFIGVSGLRLHANGAPGFFPGP